MCPDPKIKISENRHDYDSPEGDCLDLSYISESESLGVTVSERSFVLCSGALRLTHFESHVPYRNGLCTAHWHSEYLIGRQP